MANQKHSFVALHCEAWLAGTSRMTRLVKSVYFDVCMYNWEHAEPCPEAEMTLMLADLEGQGERILNQLIKAGKVKQAADGGFFNDKAMEEATKAKTMYLAKSTGGKKARNNDAGKTQNHESLQQSYEESLHHSSDHSSIELRDKITDSKKEKDLEDSVPTGLVVSPSENDTPAEPVEPPLPEGDGEEEQEEDVPASAISKEDIATMADAWNTMAVACGLSQVTKLTEDRRKKMRGRIKDHGIDEIVAAIQTVPASPFLTGKRTKWKADFDFVLQVKSMNKLVEGAYHNEGSDPSQGSAWR